MRVVVIASAVGASMVSGSGESMGCLGAPGQDIEVRWEAPSGPGSSGIQLIGCEDWSIQSHTGESFAATSGRYECSVQGWRKDGQLHVLSTPVQIDARAEKLIVDFDLPHSSHGIGGIGARLHATGWGARVDDVLPGYAADRAGLRPGDLIVEVDGVAAGRMSTSHVVRVITGAPDTEVTLGIERASELHRFTLGRERIPD